MFLPPLLMDAALQLCFMHEVVLAGSRFHNFGSADVTGTIRARLSIARVAVTTSPGRGFTGKFWKFLAQFARVR